MSLAAQVEDSLPLPGKECSGTSLQGLVAGASGTSTLLDGLLKKCSGRCQRRHLRGSQTSSSMQGTRGMGFYQRKIWRRAGHT